MKKNLILLIAICLFVTNAIMAQTPVPATVNPLGTITGNPVNDTICANAGTSFSVTAVGVALTYAWYESPNGTTGWVLLTDGGTAPSILNSTTNTLIMGNIPIGKTGYYYRCGVKEGGNCEVYSTAAKLTLIAAPTFSTNPVTKTVCSLTNTTFTIVAAGAGTPFTYQWFESTDGGLTYNPCVADAVHSNVTTATLTLTGIPESYTGYKYRCEATNTTGCVGTSAAATLTVSPSPSVVGPAPTTPVCDLDATNIGVIASVTSGTLTYQYKFSINNGTSYSNCTNGTTYSNATTATLGINATLSMNNYLYEVVVTANGCSITSSPDTLKVNALPTAYAVTATPGSSYCAGGTGTGIQVANTQVSKNYELYAAGAPTGIILAGTGAAITFTNVLAGTYTVVATDATTGCDKQMTGTVIITINPLPTATGLTFTTVCDGNPMPVTITGLTGTSPWKIEIYDQVAGAPGSVIHTQTGVATSTATFNMPTNWTGTQNKYGRITDAKGCIGWR